MAEEQLEDQVSEPTAEKAAADESTQKKPADVAQAPVDEAASGEQGSDAASDESVAAEAATTKRVRGRGRVAPAGIAHVRSTFNNTMVSITDMRGGAVSWSTAGKAGFKGSRKSTAFAATMVGQDAARIAVAKGMHEVEVRVQGAGAGRESAVRALQSAGLSITMIKDVTPIPHNGCRPRKRRRV